MTPGQTQEQPQGQTQEIMQCMEVWGGNEQVDSEVKLPGLDAWVYSRPYQQAASGGDLHYVSSCATGRITRLLLADVSGHGSPVGKLTTTLRDLMRKNVNYFNQSQFVEAMNTQFSQVSQAGIFATAVVTSFFAPSQELLVSNAGHPPPLLYRTREQRWYWLEHPDTVVARKPDQLQQATENPSNIPLGLIDATQYDQFQVTLEVGDLVVCYTDSLIESNDTAGEMLGPQGLMKQIQKFDASKPGRIIPQLLESIGGLSPDNLTKDDVTVMIFRCNGQARRTPLGRRLLTPFRLFAAVFKGLLPGGGVIPWPEMTLRNMGLDFFSTQSPNNAKPAQPGPGQPSARKGTSDH